MDNNKRVKKQDIIKPYLNSQWLKEVCITQQVPIKLVAEFCQATDRTIRRHLQKLKNDGDSM